MTADAPRAGSAEAKYHLVVDLRPDRRCTPCRQRRGKAWPVSIAASRRTMHPVQAAPRQSIWRRGRRGQNEDAPRAGSAEAKSLIASVTASRWGCTPCRQRRGKGGAVGGGNRQRPDAPRAGSAQRNNNVPPDGSLTTGRHFFTFPPSRIPTVAPSSSVTMYNPAPHLLDRSSMAKQNLSYRANVICDGAPPRISAAAVV